MKPQVCFFAFFSLVLFSAEPNCWADDSNLPTENSAYETLKPLDSAPSDSPSLVDVSAGDDSDPKSERIELPVGKYVTGGVLASTVGFGIGHIIHGRWQEKGWIFTVAESVGILAALYGAPKCTKTATRLDDCSPDNDGQPGLFFAGLGLWAGFHAWEIVDAWTGAKPVKAGAAKFAFLPDPALPQLNVVWSF